MTTQIEVLKKIGKFIEKLVELKGENFKPKDYPIPPERLGVEYMCQVESIIGLKPGESNYFQKASYIRLQKCIQKKHGYETLEYYLNEFKQLMTENPNIDYCDGCLWATADIGIDNNDVSLFLAFDFDPSGVPVIRVVFIDHAYIKSSKKDVPIPEHWGEIDWALDCGYLHDSWHVKLPEYRWYHLPGEPKMITHQALNIEDVPLINEMEFDNMLSFKHANDISNILVYLRTITKLIGSRRGNGTFF